MRFAFVLTASLLSLIPAAGSGQIAHTGPVAEVTGVGNVLHMIADLKRSMAFYRDTLGFKVNRAPRGPADDPAAYIKALPNIPPMYLLAEDGMYRSAEMFLSSPAVRLELEDFKGRAPNAVRPRLVDPGATVLMLWVKDVDAMLKAVTQASAEVVSAGKKPVTMKAESGSQRILFVKDPDGFLIEFIQPNPLPASAAAAEQNAFNTGLAVSVNDLDYTTTFFKEYFGFQVREGADFVTDQPYFDAAGLTKGISIRRASTTVPGSTFPVEFMEFRGAERKAVFPAIHDPGGTMLRLSIRDMPSTVKNLRAAGIPINSTLGEPMGPNGNLIVRAPDGLFLQLTAGGGGRGRQ
jgi:catechol 2,3-dioxygenase-like lactoylglutathione lyase family enzyme